jgi:4-carboxymuconolactone decarboxylase
MPRLPPLDPATLSPEQRAAYDEIIRVRGHVRGPFAIWLHSPELCRHALTLQDWLPKHAALERRLLELMILVVARRATAQFAWYVHEPHALRLGIAQDVIEAIRARRTPEFTREDEQLVYDLTNELDATRTLSVESYRRGIEVLGAQAMVELVSAVGSYAMVAMTLNAFDAPVPGDGQPLA